MCDDAASLTGPHNESTAAKLALIDRWDECSARAKEVCSKHFPELACTTPLANDEAAILTEFRQCTDDLISLAKQEMVDRSVVDALQDATARITKNTIDTAGRRLFRLERCIKGMPPVHPPSPNGQWIDVAVLLDTAIVKMDLVWQAVDACESMHEDEEALLVDDCVLLEIARSVREELIAAFRLLGIAAPNGLAESFWGSDGIDHLREKDEKDRRRVNKSSICTLERAVDQLVDTLNPLMDHNGNVWVNTATGADRPQQQVAAVQNGQGGEIWQPDKVAELADKTVHDLTSWLDGSQRSYEEEHSLFHLIHRATPRLQAFGEAHKIVGSHTLGVFGTHKDPRSGDYQTQLAVLRAIRQHALTLSAKDAAATSCHPVVGDGAKDTRDQIIDFKAMHDAAEQGMVDLDFAMLTFGRKENYSDERLKIFRSLEKSVRMALVAASSAGVDVSPVQTLHDLTCFMLAWEDQNNSECIPQSAKDIHRTVQSLLEKVWYASSFALSAESVGTSGRAAFSEAMRKADAVPTVTESFRAMQHGPAMPLGNAACAESAIPQQPESERTELDESNTVASSEILRRYDPKGQVLTDSALTKLLNKHHDRIRTYKPSKNRRRVHLVDWEKWYKAEYGE